MALARRLLLLLVLGSIPLLAQQCPQGYTLVGSLCISPSGSAAIPSYIVSGLPGSATVGTLAIVTDALTAGSCTSGLGSALSLCRWTGSAWATVGGSGGTGTLFNVYLVSGLPASPANGLFALVTDANPAGSCTVGSGTGKSICFSAGGAWVPVGAVIDGAAITTGTINAARIPTLNQNTTGTAANVTGTVATANGGTGSTGLTGIRKANGASADTAAAAGTDYQAVVTLTTTGSNCAAPTLISNVLNVPPGTGGSGGGGGTLTDATPGASPTYNFSTGAAGGTSSASACSSTPCTALLLTLSANTTAPAFTFGSTICLVMCTITVNQGSTAYTGFTWPSNVVGAPDVTVTANKYTSISGYYDTSKSALVVTGATTNDFGLIKSVAGPTKPPTNTGDAWNWFETAYNAGAVWGANMNMPKFSGVIDNAPRKVGYISYCGTAAVMCAYGDSLGNAGTLSAVVETATTPVYGSIPVVSNGAVGVNGGPNQTVGRTRGMQLECMGWQTVLTAIRFSPCMLSGYSLAVTLGSDNTGATAAYAMIVASTTGGSPISTSTDYALCVANGTTETCADMGLPFASGTYIASGPHRFHLYEDTPNSQWCASIDTSARTCVSNATGPVSPNAFGAKSGAWGIGAASGNYALVYLQVTSDYF